MTEKFAKGGLVTGPDGEDSVPVNISPGEEHFTAEQIRSMEETRGGEEPGEWKVACDVIPVVRPKDDE